MAVTYSTATKTARMTAVRDQIDAGGAAGKLEICTAGYSSVLATITLGYSGASTGTVSGTVLTLAGFPRSDTGADATGTAAVARILPAQTLTLSPALLSACLVPISTSTACRSRLASRLRSTALQSLTPDRGPHDHLDARPTD